MAWPEREIEERLYEIPEVLAARVSDEDGSLHVGVLVRPTTDLDALPPAILDRIEAVAGAVPETVDLRVMPLGATAETRTVRPGGPAPEGMPEAPAETTTSAPAETAWPRPPASVRPSASPVAPEASPGPDRSSRRPGTAAARTVLARVTAIQEGANFAAEVELHAEERSATGRAEGLATRVGTQRLVAQATANGLDELDGAVRNRRGIEFVDVLSSAGGEIAVVGVVVDDAVDRMVTGSASVRGGNRLDAVARAVLDATNRQR